MTFLQNTVEIVRELAPTHTALELTMKMRMSLTTLYRLLKENPDIKLREAKRGRPKKF